jgi:hypothetical protein
MRREAEQGRRPAGAVKLGPIDPAKRPLQESETSRELDATIDWLAHIHAGRIPCPEPVDGEVR